MKFIKSKFLVGLFCFVLGIGAALAAQQLITRHKMKLKTGRPARLLSSNNPGPMNMDPLLNQFFDDDFFSRSHDPFKEMRQMREEMMKDFDQPDIGKNIFDSWYRGKFGGGDIGEIKKREDKNFVYYDIAIQGIDRKNLKFKIADGQIMISGIVHKQSRQNGNGTYFSSSFQRSFPVPDGVDPQKVQLEQTQDRLTLKFPKTNANA